MKKPEDGPDLNFEKGKGRHRKSREHPARALAWIELIPTHDATLPAYPRIAIDVPREIATQYRDGEFGIGLWNSGEKDSAYRLAVEEVDQSATPPPMVVHAPPSGPKPSASPSGSPKPGAPTMMPFGTPAPSPSPLRGPNGLPIPATGVNRAAGPSAAPTLPPARMLFAGTATPLKLVANRPAVFVIYALPHPAAAPAPSGNPKPVASAKVTATPPPPSPPTSAPAPSKAP